MLQHLLWHFLGVPRRNILLRMSLLLLLSGRVRTFGDGSGSGAGATRIRTSSTCATSRAQPLHTVTAPGDYSPGSPQTLIACSIFIFPPSCMPCSSCIND